MTEVNGEHIRWSASGAAPSERSDWWPDWWGRYVGAQVRYVGNASGWRQLSSAHCKRLAGLSERSFKRMRQRGDVNCNFVDLIAVCINQQFACHICGLPMYVSDFKSADRISVEHDPPVSRAKEHTSRTVRAAHLRCNHEKGDSHAND